MQRSWHSWAIFLGSVVYSIVGFELYWTRGPGDLSFAFAGMVALPAVYGWLWKIVGGGNGELGLRAFVASGVWYAAILFLVLAHYPPLADLRQGRPWTSWQYTLMLICPLLIALVVSIVQCRAMAGILAATHRDEA